MGLDLVNYQNRGERDEMLKIERELVETLPGPENFEPWAGKSGFGGRELEY